MLLYQEILNSEKQTVFFSRKSRFELVESTIYETPHESAINISDHLTHRYFRKDRRNGKSLAIINGHFAFTEDSRSKGSANRICLTGRLWLKKFLLS